MKVRKTYKISLLTYFLVSIVVIGVSLGTYFLVGAWFSNFQTLTGQITLGEIDFQVTSSLNTINTEETNLFMPSEVIDNSIIIVNARDTLGQDTEGLANVLVRVKPFFTINSVPSEEFLYVELTNPSSWVEGLDGYVYYKQIFTPSSFLNFNNNFQLSYLLDNQFQDLAVYLSVEVEAIQASSEAYLALWTSAPTEWKTTIETFL